MLSSLPTVYADTDLNGDGVIDIFDYILAKRNAIEEAAPFCIAISDAEGAPGDTVSVAFDLAQNTGCCGLSFVVDYAPELTPATDTPIVMDENNFTAQHAQADVMEDANAILYYTTVVKECTDNGNLFTASFRIPEDAVPGTSYTMTVKRHDIVGLNYEEIPLLTGRGRITVLEPQKEPATAEPFIRNGIDVSQWQGNIDFEQVKQSADFVIMRAGFGKLATQVDKQFVNNYNKAKAAGMPVGAYWFSYALTPEEAKQEAQACIAVLGDRKFEYPIAMDVEYNKQLALGKEKVSEIIIAFCSELEAAGYYVSVYAPASYLTYTVNEQVKKNYDIWVAHVNVSQPGYNGAYGIWQYTWKARINGISTDVDRDYSYRDYPAIMARAGLNGY